MAYLKKAACRVVMEWDVIWSKWNTSKSTAGLEGRSKKSVPLSVFAVEELLHQAEWAVTREFPSWRLAALVHPKMKRAGQRN